MEGIALMVIPASATARMATREFIRRDSGAANLSQATKPPYFNSPA